jgi:ABC-2 type transport system permease protein
MAIKVIYALWLRDMIRYTRAKSRIIGTLGMPFFFMAVFGFGLNNVVAIEGANYFEFLVPGILGMTLLFNSIFTGLSVIEDKQFGFFKEILIAPVSRKYIVIGRGLGGATMAVIQAILVLILAFFLGFSFPISLETVALLLLIMFLTSFGFVCLGLSFASKMTDPHGFQLIMNFFIFPLFLLSGAFFPLDQIPEWLRFVTFIDPLTYAIDSFRALLIGVSYFPIEISIACLFGFSLFGLALATWLFSRTE